MDRVIIVEVLDRAGAVRDRFRVTAFPSTIGRGYASDIILDDGYVSPQHARIALTPDGTVMLEDLGSTNGIHIDGRRVPQVDLGSGAEVRLGHTAVRFATPETPVAPALLDRPRNPNLAIVRSSRTAAVAVCAGLAAFVLWSWGEAIERITAVDLMGEAIGVLAAMAMWAGLWALASRLAVHRFEFLAHATVGSAALAIVFVYTELGAYVHFLVPSPVVSAAVALGAMGLGAAWLYGHLSFASRLPPHRRFAWATSITVGMLVVGWVLTLAEQESFSVFTDDPGVLKPVPASLVPARSVDDYVAELAELKAEVDGLAD